MVSSAIAQLKLIYRKKCELLEVNSKKVLSTCSISLHPEYIPICILWHLILRTLYYSFSNINKMRDDD